MDLPYRAEYSKSGRAKCRGCSSAIAKEVLRLGVKMQAPTFDGKIPHWYHEECFFTEYQPKTVDDIDGFESLRWEDQKKIEGKIVSHKKGKKRNSTATAAKKALSDFVIEYSKSSRVPCRSCELKIMKEKVQISKKDFETDGGDGCQDMWYHLTCFAKLRAELGYFESGDKLPGFKTLNIDDQKEVLKQLLAIKQEDISEKKAKIEDETDGPDPREKEMKEQNEVMFKYRDQLDKLKKKELQLLLESNKQKIPPGVHRILDQLCDIMTFGTLLPCDECIGGQLVYTKFGYKCRGMLTEWTTCCFITKDPKRRKFKVPSQLAEKYSFLKEYKYVSRTRIINDINPTISTSHVKKEENGEPSSSSSLQSKSKSGSMVTGSMSSKMKLKLKDGSVVDPDSGLVDIAHVYQSRSDKYTEVLALTDIQKKKNSYYKLQLLQSDSGNQFWLFRSWGRIGTSNGDCKIEEMGLHEAKKKFCRLYEEKTGNPWENRDHFEKVPGRMYRINVDYVEKKAKFKLNSDPNIPSKLAKPVQELIQLIFDVNSMKKVMLEFELDTEKMPLGKLSQVQLQSAYGVLYELQHLVKTNAQMNCFTDASNRFYTFVPHSLGPDNAPVIHDIETIKKKKKMLNNLRQLEIAYSPMKSAGGNNAIDDYYDQLKTEINLLHSESEEFSIIKEYVKNTHAATHANYELDIKEVCTVKRHGEGNRCKLHNRKLLWHGSRTTNYASILRQGLRIAPPKVPVAGYMFGKGIYFADMVSKSANYCCTSPNANTGLLLLCEVALGEMYELNHAKYVKKLPKGKHSVKGVGRTQPDPAKVVKIHGDVEVPVGQGIPTDRPGGSSLLYNEYIVYDVAQVHIRYLIKLDFKYK